MAKSAISQYLVVLLVGLLLGALGGYLLFGGNKGLAEEVASAVVQAQQPANNELLAAVTAEIDPRVYEQLQQTAARQSTEIEELEASLSQAVSAQQTAEAAIANNNQTLDRLIAERNRLKSELDVATQDVARLTQSNQNQQESMAAVQTETVAQLETLTNERDQLFVQVGRLEAEVADLANRNAETSVIAQQAETLQSQIDQFEQLAETEKANAERFEEQLRLMLAAREEDATVLRELQRRASTAEQEVERLRGQLANASSATASLETITAERNQLAVRIEELHSSNEAERSRAAILQERLDTLTASAAQAQEESEAALLVTRSSLAELQAIIDATPEPIDPAVVAERDELRAQVAALEAERASVQVDRDALTSEVARLSAVEEDLTTRYNGVVEQYNGLANLYNQLLEQARVRGN